MGCFAKCRPDLGDGDLFHWDNTSGYGSDEHFSVFTLSPPGYFLPEEIKNVNMNPSNLVFSFSIPRSANPKTVFDVMLNAVKYCQKRLGGEILNQNGRPFDEVKEKMELSQLVSRMNERGIVPGANKTLVLFRD